MWIFPDGDHAFLDEEKSNQPDLAPYQMLSRIVRLFNGEGGEEKGFKVLNLNRWVNQNPPPSEEGDGELQQWCRQLAVMAIYCGLTLVWRGGIVTSLTEKDKLKKLIQQTGSFPRLQWPESAVITLTILSEEEGSSDQILRVEELVQG